MTIRETVPAVMLSAGSSEDGQISDCRKTFGGTLELRLGDQERDFGRKGGPKKLVGVIQVFLVGKGQVMECACVCV